MARMLAPALFAATLIGAGAALAEDDECRSPMSQWAPQDAAMRHAAELGIDVNRLKIDDGCYQIRGRDGDGNRVQLKLDPASLGLVELKVQFRPGADPSRYVAGAKPVAAERRGPPPENRLFAPGGGGAPRVEQN